MTLPNRHHAAALAALASALLISLTGCASHTDAVTAPAGTKLGAPMTPAQQQAADQVSAARAAKRNGQ